MKYLALLRKLADHNQFDELKNTCLLFWDETQEASILPLLAIAHIHSGEPEEAEKTCRLAEAHHSSFDSDALVDMAVALFLLNRHQEAEKILNHVLKQHPYHTSGLIRLGLWRIVQENFKSARKLFQKAASVKPCSLSLLFHLAHVNFQLSDYPSAQLAVKKAKKLLEENTGDLPHKVFEQYRYLLNAIQLKIRVATKQFSHVESWLKELNQTLNENDFIHWLIQYSHLLAEIDHHQHAADILREYLKLFPDNVSLYSHLADLEHLQGHFIPSVNLLNTALLKDENNISLWVKLSHVSLRFFNKKARMAAEKAVELADNLPENSEQQQSHHASLTAEAQTALARVESHEQNFETAERLYLNVLESHKNYIPALSGLGHQKIQQGQIDEALNLFRQIKKINPVQGSSSLIIGGNFPEETEILYKMEKAAQQSDLKGSVQAGILFQLAAAWDKRKEHDKAISFAKQANLARKKSLTYNSKNHRNYCARIRTGFSKELFETRPDYGINTTLPVYIVGMPRSGTTLVEQILAGHSQIFGAGELGTIPQVILGLNRWQRYIGSGRRYPDCMDDLTSEVTKGIAGNTLDELTKLSPESKYIIDKLPHNFENIGLIKFLFPRSKIISVRRDPRDIALSNFFTDYQTSHNGMGFAYDLETIGEQLADHNLLMHHWQQLFPKDIHEIHYEDVVDNLEDSARGLLSFIGVAWEADVLKFNSLKRPVKTASAWQVRQPIYTTSKSKWKNYKNHLQPLIKGTNAKIRPEPYEMKRLPEAGFLTDGVDLYRKNDLDGAELSFKKMLHHNPDHAACNYMVGMVYLRKNHLLEGIRQIEKALQTAPWQTNWRNMLTKAYKLAEAKPATDINVNSKTYRNNA